ncbi:hypothetical protein MRX96_049526 [Rhipicephalus microplus]
MSGGAQRDAASVAAGVAAGGDAARSWRALHADLRPTGSSADTCAADLKKPSSWEPKPPPLPDADYKVILRIRGGLDCTKLHPCVLRQLVLKAVGLPISSPDQIRVNPTSHTVLPSEVPSSRTPSLNRSQERGPQRGRSKSKRRGPNSTPKELDFPTQSTNPPFHQSSAKPIKGKLGTGSFL